MSGESWKIRYGWPDVEKIMKDLHEKHRKDSLDDAERKKLKLYVKALNLISTNPKHNSLNTHEIRFLSQSYGIKIWQSYLKNNAPSAGRVFWCYGPGKREITICSFEPHPNQANTVG